MKFLTILQISVMICTNFSQILTQEFCGVRRNAVGLTIGGKDMLRGSHPWIVALMKTVDESPPEYLCSGTLISKRHIVTGVEISRRLVSLKVLCFF